MTKRTYFKSFVTMEHMPVTTTYEPLENSRKTCQTLAEILEKNIMTPNTAHSQLKKRLCVSLLHEGYLGTYRPEGFIFETNHNPNYAVPFDMMALTNGETFTSADYNRKFLNGFQKYQYTNVDDLLAKYPASDKAIDALNEFRKKYDLKAIEKNSMNYNECCFIKDIKITPVAIIGQGCKYQELAKKYNIPIYGSIRDFYKNNNLALNIISKISQPL